MARSYLKFTDSIVFKLTDSIEASIFLNKALQKYELTRDMSSLMISLRYLVEAQGGVSKFAERTGLNRQNLYKVLTGKTIPRFDTVLGIINGLGFSILATFSERP